MTITTSLTIRRLGGALGAEVEEIDLAQPISESTLAELRQAFAEHLVLVFHGQGHLTPQQHSAFAARWGTICELPLKDGNGLKTHDNHRVVELFYPAHQQRANRTDMWHTDFSYDETPPAGSFLLARQIPPAGGDTMWANQYLAWETLSARMRGVLSGLLAVHTGERFRSGVYEEDGESVSLTAVHPAVRTIPETGRKALYVNSYLTSHFEGMTVAESKPLLDFLTSYCVQPNFTFRHRWQAGDLVMWDNRCVQHYAIWDYLEQRMMHRVNVAGERPYLGN